MNKPWKHWPEKNRWRCPCCRPWRTVRPSGGRPQKNTSVTTLDRWGAFCCVFVFIIYFFKNLCSEANAQNRSWGGFIQGGNTLVTLSSRQRVLVCASVNTSPSTAVSWDHFSEQNAGLLSYCFIFSVSIVKSEKRNIIGIENVLEWTLWLPIKGDEFLGRAELSVSQVCSHSLTQCQMSGVAPTVPGDWTLSKAAAMRACARMGAWHLWKSSITMSRNTSIINIERHTRKIKNSITQNFQISKSSLPRTYTHCDLYCLGIC